MLFLYPTIMKKTSFLLLFVLLFASVGQAQSLEKLFNKYADNEHFEYTSLGKGVLGFFNMFADYTEVTDGMMSKITGVKILKLDSDASHNTLTSSFSNEIDKIIKKGKFEKTLESREKNAKTYIYKKADKKSNADLLILTEDYKGISLIWLKGKMAQKTKEADEVDVEENDSII